MQKIKSVMPLWGPYSKKYSGISRIVDHAYERGVRLASVLLYPTLTLARRM